MTIAKVNILHPILAADGWLMPGPAEMDADEARQHEARGYVDVLEVDGKPEVWAPCCSDHPHP